MFIVSVSREEGGAEWYCTILGTRLSETVCVAVGLIGVKGGEECLQSDTGKYRRKRVTAVGMLDSGILPPEIAQKLMKNKYGKKTNYYGIFLRTFSAVFSDPRSPEI